jgi:hypothetical protein
MPQKKQRRRTQLTLSIAPEAKEGLEKLAADAGLWWGDDKPNVSRLVESIGLGLIKISDARPASEAQLEAFFEHLKKVALTEYQKSLKI